MFVFLLLVRDCSSMESCNNRSESPCLRTADSFRQLDVFGENRHPLCMNRTQVRVFENSHKKCFCCLLQSDDGCSLPLQKRPSELTNFFHQPENMVAHVERTLCMHHACMERTAKLFASQKHSRNQLTSEKAISESTIQSTSGTVLSDEEPLSLVDTDGVF